MSEGTPRPAEGGRRAGFWHGERHRTVTGMSTHGQVHNEGRPRPVVLQSRALTRALVSCAISLLLACRRASVEEQDTASVVDTPLAEVGNPTGALRDRHAPAGDRVLVLEVRTDGPIARYRVRWDRGGRAVDGSVHPFDLSTE